ncbi:MAG: hypothetical protein OFPI_34890 [Osedax symbiont Rs2]|nr:MAG: hypothetical protein OFPI_34890 [Osedax symbiont Rs2]
MPQPSQIVIAAAAIADFKQIKALYLASDEYHFQQSVDEFKSPAQMSEQRDEIGFKQLLETKNCIVLAASYQQKIIGIVAGNVSDQQSFILRQKLIGHIDEVAVDPDYRGLGCAKKLIGAIEDKFSQFKVEEIVLNVYQFNSGARALYQQMGYREKLFKLAKSL